MDLIKDVGEDGLCIMLCFFCFCLTHILSINVQEPGSSASSGKDFVSYSNMLTIQNTVTSSYESCACRL